MDTTRSTITPSGTSMRRVAIAARHAAREQPKARRARLGVGAKRAAAAIGMGVVVTVILMLFFMLLWLRGPVRLLLSLVSGASLFTLPIFWLGVHNEPWKTTILLTLAGIGFGSFVLMWFYDTLLLRLAPGPLILTD